MADYNVEHPKFGKVRVTGIADNLTGDDRDRAIEAKIFGGEYTRNTMAEKFSGIVAPVTDFVSRLVHGNTQSAMAQMATAPTFGQKSPELLGAFRESMDTKTTPFSDATAKVVVPQTMSQAGAMAATLPLAGVGGLLGAGARVAAGAAGGAGGAMLEGGSPLEGALWGGGANLVGEGIGYGVGKVLRSLPGQRQRINQSDVDVLSEYIADRVPAMRRTKSPSDLARQARALETRDAMSQDFRNALDAINETLKGQKITVPSLGVTQTVKKPGVFDAAGKPVTEGKLGPLPTVDATVTKPLTIADAVDELGKLGYAGFGGTKANPTERTVVGLGDRQRWESAITEIEAELKRLNPTGEAVDAFKAARREYALGKSFLKMLRSQGAFRGGDNIVEMNHNVLRTYYERNLAVFESRLLAEDVRALEGILYRGGPFASRDLMPTGFGRVGDAAAQLARSGGGTGTVAVLGPRTALPNLGAQYTGRPPFTLPTGMQTGLDLLLQRAGGAPLSGNDTR